MEYKWERYLIMNLLCVVCLRIAIGCKAKKFCKLSAESWESSLNPPHHATLSWWKGLWRVNATNFSASFHVTGFMFLWGVGAP